MKQLTHKEIDNSRQKFPITLVCDAIRTPENIGMCFRIADSFGVEKIYLHENSIGLENRKVKKTARNTTEKISNERYSDFRNLIASLKNDKFFVIGLEITSTSTNIQDFDFKKYPKIALVVGSERNGISDIELLNESIAIPMYGNNSSMNVIHSLAIALYEITNQLR